MLVRVILKSTVVCMVVVAAFSAERTFAQAQAPSTAKKTVFRDSDGNLVSNNEFVDIRMANFHYPDATVVKTLADGTVEFRLQKIPQEGMAAPNFSAKTVDGKTLNFAKLKGKVVVLNFWFIGCPVCLAHKPKLNELAVKFAGNDDVMFIAMTADRGDDVKKYINKERSEYIQVADAKPTLDMFSFAGYPKNIVIGKSGEIVYWRSTIRAWDKIESVIRAEIEK